MDDITKEELKGKFKNGEKPDQEAFHTWMDMTLFQDEDGLKRVKRDRGGEKVLEFLELTAGENNELILLKDKDGGEVLEIKLDGAHNLQVGSDTSGQNKVTIDGGGNITVQKIEAKNGLDVVGGNLSVKTASGGTTTTTFSADSSGDLEVTGDIRSKGTNATLQVGTAAAGYPIPSGGIIMWSGNTIPVGWFLCNGQNGTPDLRGRFIVGRTDDEAPNGNTEGNRAEYKVGATESGGQRQFTLSESNLPAHDHIKASSKDGDGKVFVANAGAHRHFVAKNQSAGEVAVSSSNTIGHHTDVHDYEEYRLQAVSADADVGRTNSAGNHKHEVTFLESIGKATPDAIDILPPYFVLAFIMKG